MNKKRIAAIVGLIGMAICILSMVVSGFLPEMKDLLMTIGMFAFILAVSISLFFYFRKKEEEEAAQAAKEPEKDGESPEEDQPE